MQKMRLTVAANATKRKTDKEWIAVEKGDHTIWMECSSLQIRADKHKHTCQIIFSAFSKSHRHYRLPNHQFVRSNFQNNYIWIMLDQNFMASVHIFDFILFYCCLSAIFFLRNFVAKCASFDCVNIFRLIW